MGLYKKNDIVASSISFACALISLLSCAVVINTITTYLQKKQSYHLQLVGRLLLSDMGISSCLIIYYFAEHFLGSNSVDDFCNAFLPLIVFFFLASFSWTIMLALRFRVAQNVAATKVPSTLPIPFKWVWAFPVFVGISLQVVMWSAKNISQVQSGSDVDRSCTFDHDTWSGIITDLTAFQMPILLTIAINIYIYACGLAALSNAPHSVLARQMHKAGGYLAVLVVVWVPNLVYNLISIIDTSDNEYGGLLDLSILLMSLQGFLNVCVYVWSNEKMRSWLWRTIRKRWRQWRRQPAQPPKTNASRSRASLQPTVGDADEFSDEDDDALPWLRDAESFSGHLHDSELGGKDSATTHSLTVSNSNSLVDRGGSVIESTMNPVAAPAPAATEPIKIKSILVRSSTHQSRTSSQPSSVAYSQELDQERFVRFGETSTRIISVAATPKISSDFMLAEDNIAEEDDVL